MRRRGAQVPVRPRSGRPNFDAGHVICANSLGGAVPHEGPQAGGDTSDLRGGPNQAGGPGRRGPEGRARCAHRP